MWARRVYDEKMERDVIIATSTFSNEVKQTSSPHVLSAVGAATAAEAPSSAWLMQATAVAMT